MILQETPRNLDPETIVKDNFNYQVSGYSAYKFLFFFLFRSVTPVPRKLDQTISCLSLLHLWLSRRYSVGN